MRREQQKTSGPPAVAASQVAAAAAAVAVAVHSPSTAHPCTTKRWWWWWWRDVSHHSWCLTYLPTYKCIVPVLMIIIIRYSMESVSYDDDDDDDDDDDERLISSRSTHNGRRTVCDCALSSHWRQQCRQYQKRTHITTTFVWKRKRK